jgi:phosphoglycolate phosphatase-like HAD superfamily hydrolase
VIGDTPQDILHGQAAGAKVIAVASGFYSLEELQGFSPELAVAALAPAEPVLSFIQES